VTSNNEVRQLLGQWDVAKTDSLLPQIAAARAEKEAKAQAEKAEVSASLREQFRAAEEEYRRCQAALQEGYAVWNTHIEEYDIYVRDQGGESTKLSVLQAAITDAEDRLLELKDISESATAKYQAARSAITMYEDGTEAGQEELRGQPVALKVLGDVLDVQDPQCCYVVDISRRASTFLRHRSYTTYLKGCSKHDMEAECLRQALLGALQFGKQIVLDMMDVDNLDFIKERFDTVLRDLLEMLLDQSFTVEKNILPLAQDLDANEIEGWKMSDFRFIIVTHSRRLNEYLVKRMHLVRVTIDDSD